MKIAIFASGRGSNFESIYQSTQTGVIDATIGVVLTNNPRAVVLQTAQRWNIPNYIVHPRKSAEIIDILEQHEIDFIVLAGYLRLIPSEIVAKYPKRIVNIHPALLPKFGGKGFYGHFVHEAVIAASEKDSGLTIHFVDEQYDNGSIIFQKKVAISPDDTADTLGAKILKYEHIHYPQIIGKLLHDIGGGK